MIKYHVVFSTSVFRKCFPVTRFIDTALCGENWHTGMIAWKHFCITGHMWGKYTVIRGLHSRRPVMLSFDVFLLVNWNKLLKKKTDDLPLIWDIFPSRDVIEVHNQEFCILVAFYCVLTWRVWTFYPTHYMTRNYLPMLRFKLIRIS